MKKFSRFIAMIAFLLTVSIFVSSEPCQMVSAITGQDVVLSKQYLKEVKMFYGKSQEEAKSACEQEGYTFCSTNLNEGAPNVFRDDQIQYNEYGENTNPNDEPTKPMYIYLGYKTTENPDNAITDLTLLDMKRTHFEEVDYEEYMNSHLSDFKDQAEQMMVLVGELKRKMAAGSPNAQMAYDSLNMFYVDEKESHDAEKNMLGYYLVNYGDVAFFEKFIQRGNSMVLGKIIDLLCSATADYSDDGTTWVDRAKTSEVAYEFENGTSETRNYYRQLCEDPAKDFVKAIKDFNNTYTEAKQRYDAYGETLGYSELKGMTEENATDKLLEADTDCRYPEFAEALRTYELLDAFTFTTAGEKVENKAGLLEKPADGEDATEPDGNETNTNAADAATVTYSSSMTLAQYIISLANDATLEDHLSTVYPIVNALTEPQRAALSLGGLSAIIEGLYQSTGYASKRSQAIKESSDKLKENGCADGRVYLWAGTDSSVYKKKVVKTDATKEAEGSGIDLQNSINEQKRKENSNLSQILMIVDICTLGYGGIMMVVGAFLSSSMWSIGTNLLGCAGMYLAAQMVGMASLTAVAGVVMCTLWVLNIVSMVVGFAMLIYSILEWTGALDVPKQVDYTEIPDIVFDARQADDGTYSVRYDSVTSNASKTNFLGDRSELAETLRAGAGGFTINVKDISSDHAEMTGYQGYFDRWVALYYSKAPAAGEPIEVKPGEEPFVTKSDYQAPEGYQPLTLIHGASAEDVNDVEVFMKKSPSLYVFFPGENLSKVSGGVVADSGQYVTKVRLSYAKKQEDAINRLKKENYQYIDVNLTPYEGFTYLGYQLGSEANAYTDIRLSNAGADSISFGDASYAKMGADVGTEKENTCSTPDGLALFATTSKAAGTPIVGLSVESTRLEPGSGMEPVCLFSGGDAVDIGAKWKDNIYSSGTDSDYTFFTGRTFTSYNVSSKSYPYEFMSQDNPSNGIYIYFQPKEQFKSTNADGKPAQRYIGGFSYFLAGDKETDEDNNKYGSNYEFMQTFAKENGFELLTDGGEAFRVMSDEAGEMTLSTVWRDVGGKVADTYNFDQFHTIYTSDKIKVLADTDGGLIHSAGFHDLPETAFSRISRDNKKMIFHTAMYFGVSYTYNPYRAITGVSGLLTSYTETSNQIKYSGMKTPAGSLLACNVSLQGCPLMAAGIAASYYNPMTMTFPLYTNYEARQKSDLSWMTDKETEVQTHYLLTSGPRKNVLPLKEGDIAFVTHENPGAMDGFVPLCDMRSPGDYEHPMNFALDTTNKGSKHLYLYLSETAGGRKDAAATSAKYEKKQYVAAVFCGVGSNPEDAIRNLYQRASEGWSEVAARCSDVSATPLVTELDEIIPVDLSSETPWYTLHTNDTNIKSLKNGVWVRGNEAAYARWEGHDYVDGKPIDEYEKDFKCAYLGVVRTKEMRNAVYGMLKYYSNTETASTNLSTGSTKSTLAGGPVKSKEGTYYLYYSLNSGTASYTAPVTELEVSDEIFINGYNTVFTVSESDRVNNKLPEYNQLRMREDEYRYIHLGYDRAALPYYEALYLGVGKTKKEAFIDMIGSTHAYAAIDVNCNYNSSSDEWIAIGYRRTDAKGDAIKDIFIYEGKDPPNSFRIAGGYTAKRQGNRLNFSEYKDKKNVAGVEYKLLKHNLKSGSEIISLNKGNGGSDLYLYYTTASFYREKSAESEMAPITNICFTYGDISPRQATSEQLAAVFERSYYGTTVFDTSAYQNPVWECVLGISGSPENWNFNAEGGRRISLNEGLVPGMNGTDWDAPDSRVYMYVDRSDKKSKYTIRESARLPEFGYYAAESTFGYLKQVG